MPTKKDDSFTEFVLNQLSTLGNVTSRSMFGGYGLYRGQTCFGIISKGRAYFKTDPSTKPLYKERGTKLYRPNAKQTLKNYYEVPAEVLEDPDQLCEWADCAMFRIDRAAPLS